MRECRDIEYQLGYWVGGYCISARVFFLRDTSSETSFAFWGYIEYQLKLRFWGIASISWDIEWVDIEYQLLGDIVYQLKFRSCADGRGY